ncbi:response regulator [Bradyrhizobium sp. WSM2254]|uniref:phosphorylase family protein n=1 Tax=Bradyrhizobium sp. WSM2254 TaxID=1188263 RepID=UPI000428A45A|nr:response regulator [Bradyrhizobium sp. WSM2254]
MTSILLVEDNQTKIAAIALVVEELGSQHVLKIAMNVVDAKRELQNRRYDLLLLDINLPRKASTEPEIDGGLELLRWMKARGQAHRPSYIVGITSFEESFQRAKAEFNNFIWQVIPVNLAEIGWRAQLRETIGTIEEQIRPPFSGDGKSHRTDVLVVTALEQPELSAVLQLPASFEPIAVLHDASSYYKGRFVQDRRHVDVIATAASDKGLAGAAIAATKGILAFWPRYLFMTGITAGIKGRSEIGDVVFADLSWDWGSGKIKKIKGKTHFSPAPYQRRLDETLGRAAKELKADEPFLRRLWEEAEMPKPKNPPRILVGGMASGASVLQSTDAVTKVIQQHKDVLAIEMEAFSIMFAAQTAPLPRPLAIVAKSVCDFGDGKKNDKYQRYAAYVSARVFEEFSRRYLLQKGLEDEARG